MLPFLAVAFGLHDQIAEWAREGVNEPSRGALFERRYWVNGPFNWAIL